jgi:hypothetical protein
MGAVKLAPANIPQRTGATPSRPSRPPQALRPAAPARSMLPEHSPRQRHQRRRTSHCVHRQIPSACAHTVVPVVLALLVSLIRPSIDDIIDRQWVIGVCGRRASCSVVLPLTNGMDTSTVHSILEANLASLA